LRSVFKIGHLIGGLLKASPSNIYFEFSILNFEFRFAELRRVSHRVVQAVCLVYVIRMNTD